ncbi:hypothetical protein DOTSEDRAFT_69805 [Dothistroma septosporum NZE10]|uniref:Uncharacterized protein n=1 Tax=Dothistroma septosporum (strain NZE10 / CBS 128990) TaxID=675120 RepID=N1PYC9_DOTSN|nr:hypothetical protein DOTSEDRAFT_69805 [Dothistroma septosporum NZE10]
MRLALFRAVSWQVRHTRLTARVRGVNKNVGISQLDNARATRSLFSRLRVRVLRELDKLSGNIRRLVGSTSAKNA